MSEISDDRVQTLIAAARELDAAVTGLKELSRVHLPKPAGEPLPHEVLAEFRERLEARSPAERRLHDALQGLGGE